MKSATTDITHIYTTTEKEDTLRLTHKDKSKNHTQYTRVDLAQ